LNLRGFEDVGARNKRGHDESVIMQAGITPPGRAISKADLRQKSRKRGS
jgi:hypothetical protein